MQVMVEIPSVDADFGLSVLKTLSFVKNAEPFYYSEYADNKKEKKLSPPHICTGNRKFDREQANER